MESFVVKSGQGDYSVSDLKALLTHLVPSSKTVIVIDQIVADLYRQVLAPLS